MAYIFFIVPLYRYSLIYVHYVSHNYILILRLIGHYFKKTHYTKNAFLFEFPQNVWFLDMIYSPFLPSTAHKTSTAVIHILESPIDTSKKCGQPSRYWIQPGCHSSIAANQVDDQPAHPISKLTTNQVVFQPHHQPIRLTITAQASNQHVAAASSHVVISSRPWPS